MKGKILNYDKDKGIGIISTENGDRYTFEVKEWREKSSIERDMSVDFDISSEGVAKDIFFLDGHKAIKKGWFGKMSLMETYFWGFILFFMLLYIIAQVLIYSHQSNSIPSDNPLPIYEGREKIKPIISSNIVTNNSSIDNNMYKKINILYKKIDDIVLKSKGDTKFSDQKLNEIYQEYRILIKKHVQFIDRVALIRIDMDSHKTLINNIYNNLENDQLIQKSKRRILVNSPNMEKAIIELKKGYHKKFMSVSEKVRKIYEESNLLNKKPVKKVKPKEIDTTIKSIVKPTNINKEVQSKDHKVADIPENSVNKSSESKNTLTRNNSITANLKQEKTIIMNDMYRKLDFLYTEIDNLLMKTTSNNIDKTLTRIHENFKDTLKVHIGLIDDVAMKNLDLKNYETISESIFNRIKKDSVIQNAVGNMPNITSSFTVENLLLLLKKKYRNKFTTVSERVIDLYKNTEKSTIGEIK